MMENVYLQEAFKALDILNEEDFNLTSTDGFEDAKDFIDKDEKSDFIDVIDPEAETEEELKDSYVGDVILDCCVCHSKLYKHPEEVHLDEEEGLANMDEECPFCYSTDGYTIIGQVAPFEEEEEEKEEIDDEVEIEDEEEINESLTEGRVDDSSMDRLDYKTVFTYLSKRLPKGVSIDNIDINSGKGYQTFLIYLSPDKYNNDGYGYEFDYVLNETSHRDFLDYVEEMLNKSVNKVDGIDESLEEARTKGSRNKMRLEIAGKPYPTIHAIQKDGLKYAMPAKKIKNIIGSLDYIYRDGWEDDDIIDDDYFLYVNGRAPGHIFEVDERHIEDVNELMDYIFEAFSLVNSGKYKRAAVLTPDENILVDYGQTEEFDAFYNESLEESDESLKEGILGTGIGAAGGAALGGAALGPLGALGGAALGGLAGNALTNNNLTEDADISEYQKWVDFDMEKYGKISNLTMRKIKKAGFSVVKDQYGEYEVIADRKDESCEKKPVREHFEKVEIETDKEKMEMTSEENGKVVVTTEPKNDEEVIVPVSDDVQTEINDVVEIEDEPVEEEPMEDGNYEDIDVDEFSEEEFDDLGESYLKKVYENVKSFKTSNVKTAGNKLFVEGIIGFASGKNKKTSFVFESKDVNKKGKVRFIGENLQLSRGKKAFTITGSINKGKFIAESLNYNYRTKDSDGKSTRLYGTVRTKK